jgi:hypothetical protein
MLHLLKRHPLPIRAFFKRSLVLTYAYPRELLEPLLPPGLELDVFGDVGFLAIAMVQTERLRPAFLPRIAGRDFFLTGYRVFARYRTNEGRRLRGLRILRSDTDRRAMACFGNLLTHYHYRTARVEVREDADVLEIQVTTPKGEADLHVRAHLAGTQTLPAGSPFGDLREARRFAGPLPFTFDYEEETHSIIRIEGVRSNWTPLPVEVEVLRNTFIEREPFARAPARLANAFLVSRVPYEWRRGVRAPLSGAHGSPG